MISIPWTTPPVIGHYLVTGGDIRAVIWGVISICIAMAVYYPFTRIAERERGEEGDTEATVHQTGEAP